VKILAWVVLIMSIVNVIFVAARAYKNVTERYGAIDVLLASASAVMLTTLCGRILEWW